VLSCERLLDRFILDTFRLPISSMQGSQLSSSGKTASEGLEAERILRPDGLFCDTWAAKGQDSIQHLC
jgi:hypothetical protein